MKFPAWLSYCILAVAVIVQRGNALNVAPASSSSRSLAKNHVPPLGMTKVVVSVKEPTSSRQILNSTPPLPPSYTSDNALIVLEEELEQKQQSLSQRRAFLGAMLVSTGLIVTETMSLPDPSNAAVTAIEKKSHRNKDKNDSKEELLSTSKSDNSNNEPNSFRKHCCCCGLAIYFSKSLQKGFGRWQGGCVSGGGASVYAHVVAHVHELSVSVRRQFGVVVANAVGARWSGSTVPGIAVCTRSRTPDALW